MPRTIRSLALVFVLLATAPAWAAGERDITIAQGIDAELHIWEGLDHAFFFEPDLPQSREVYDVTVKFFNRHLAKAE